MIDPSQANQLRVWRTLNTPSGEIDLVSLAPADLGYPNGISEGQRQTLASNIRFLGLALCSRGEAEALADELKRGHEIRGKRILVPIDVSKDLNVIDGDVLNIRYNEAKIEPEVWYFIPSANLQIVLARPRR